MSMGTLKDNVVLLGIYVRDVDVSSVTATVTDVKS